MRLLHTSRLELREFFDANIPESYAILSHCWGDDEPSLQNWKLTPRRDGAGFKKILDCCRLAKERDLDWAWIDTICIDKTSSAELTEAINSMFVWYQRSAVCFVFLSDLRSSSESVEDHPGAFSACRWFTRGFTLQELLAPPHLILFDESLKQIGTKKSLAGLISYATGISSQFLLDIERFHQASVAQKMSCASGRQTSRAEDVAYCLLGIFDVNMPLLYGEGGKKAFLRLQQQIIIQSSDESIFAWYSDTENRVEGIFANSPDDFKKSKDIYADRALTKGPPYIVTNRGLQFQVPTAPWSDLVYQFRTGHSWRRREIWFDCYYITDEVKLTLYTVGVEVHPVSSHKGGDTEWYRTNLIHRERSRWTRRIASIFETFSPIYLIQSSAEVQRALQSATPNGGRSFDAAALPGPRFNLSEEAMYAIIPIALLFFDANIYTSTGVERNFSFQAARTWLSLTLGFSYSRGSYWFLIFVSLLLCQPFVGLAWFGISIFENLVIFQSLQRWRVCGEGDEGTFADLIIHLLLAGGCVYSRRWVTYLS